VSKKYDLVIKTGEYTDRNGETKGRYENIGAIMQGDNGHYMMLKRTFNPAGVPCDPQRDSILVSMFEPKQNNGQQGQQQRQQPQQSGGAQGAMPSDDMDDEIPFAPLDWRLA